MKESHVEGLATHNGPESCGVSGNGRAEALDRGTCGPGIEPRKSRPSRSRRRGTWRKATPDASPTRDADGSRAVIDPAHVRKHLAREPGGPMVPPAADGGAGRVGK